MNVRLSFLLVAVLVIFGGTFLVFQFRDDGRPRDPDRWLYRIDDSSIVHIEVTNGGKTGVYDRKPGSNTWLIQGEDRDYPVFLDKWGGTPLLLSGPKVDRILAEGVENLSSYGLDPPESIVKVTERSGVTYEFHMGITTPDERNQYTTLVGNPELFTVTEIWAQVINKLALEPPYARIYNLGEKDIIIHIGVDHDGQIVDYERKVLEDKWEIFGDKEGVAAREEWLTILPDVEQPPIPSPLEAETADVDLEAYGLEPPQTRVRITLRTGEIINFKMGEPTSDGKSRYVQREDEEGVSIIPEDWAQVVIGLATEPPYSAEAAAPSSSG
jgi:hypothetical protein